MTIFQYSFKGIAEFYSSSADINPKGLVPALEFKGQPLYESLIINEFLEDTYPTHGKHLLPDDTFARAQARLWIDHINKVIVPATMRLIQSQPTSEPEKVQAALEELIKGQKTLAEKVKGPYFFGDEFSLVDAALAPWITRDYVVREHRGYERSLAGEKWEKYAEALETRDSVLRTCSVGVVGYDSDWLLLTLVNTGTSISERDLWKVLAQRGAE